MSVFIDNLFGIYIQVLGLWQCCSEVLVGNLVNVDMFGYQVCDFDFCVVLMQVSGCFEGLVLSVFMVGQVDFFVQVVDKLMWCILIQFSMDGNIVDEQVEQVNFVVNGVYYQVLLVFIIVQICMLCIVIIG